MSANGKKTQKLFTHTLKHINVKVKWKHFWSSGCGTFSEELSDTTNFPCWIGITKGKVLCYCFNQQSNKIRCEDRYRKPKPNEHFTYNHSSCKLEYCSAKSLGYQLSNNKRVNGRKDLWKRKTNLRTNAVYPSYSHALNHLLEELCLCWLGGPWED